MKEGMIGKTVIEEAVLEAGPQRVRDRDLEDQVSNYFVIYNEDENEYLCV